MIIAIDPGANGAIVHEITGACRDDTATIVVPMPATRGDAITLARGLCFNEAGASVVYIEKIAGFIPGGGAGQMFHFGVNVERIGCAFQSAGARIVEVPPKTWQKALGLGGSEKIKDKAKAKRDWKNKLKAEAQRRFPGIKVTLANADALLIFEYARAAEREFLS